MEYCEHKCNKCGEEWKCEFPYYSNHDYFEEFVQQGYYCNSYCPKCKPEERKEIDHLFGVSENSQYLKSIKVSETKQI